MNERILELARQIWPDPSISHANHMRFAELIIRDCLTIIRMNDNETPWFSEADGRARTILRKVKEHFGVQ